MEHLLKLRILGIFAFRYMNFITVTFNHFKIYNLIFLMLWHYDFLFMIIWHWCLMTSSKGALWNLAYKWSTGNLDKSESLSTGLTWVDVLSSGVHHFLKCLIRSINSPSSNAGLSCIHFWLELWKTHDWCVITK